MDHRFNRTGHHDVDILAYFEIVDLTLLLRPALSPLGLE
jgi:hypothetical protein